MFLFLFFQNHSATLNADEITAVKKNLQRNGVEVNNDFVRETWAPVYRRHFINSSIARAYDCRRGFYLYHQGHTAEVSYWFFSPFLGVISVLWGM